MKDKVQEKDFKKVYVVEPNQNYDIEGLRVQTISSYNINKQFHPKDMRWVGYIIELKGVLYYIAGDTDITLENRQVKCDVAFVPVGGTYTMTYKEAAELVNEIKPKIAVPVHYGSIVGTDDDAKRFVELLNQGIEGKK